MNFSHNVKSAAKWLENNSTNSYVFTTSVNKIPYHEVSGYYIPTLITYGYREKAKSFAEYLISQQKEDGSWSPHGVYSSDMKSYVFDAAQIIDGLSEFGNQYAENIEKAIGWVTQNMETAVYQHPDVKKHYYMRILYCLKKAGFDVESMIKKYLDDKSIYEFDVLSHFYGYAFEGCARLGLDCSPFISEVVKYSGLIPERKGINTFCFVGLSQVALSLFLCNNPKYGMKTLEFVSSFQNKSGGFYGSNGKYFPQEEISWAVKFYLDAFWECQRSWFVDNIRIFPDYFEGGLDDPRLKFVKKNVLPQDKVLDVGCGKGRYINNLNCERYACDIADASKYVNANFSIGSCLNLPYENNFFDVVVCAESMEHALLFENAVKECKRVLKNEGKLIIIDKNKATKTNEILHFGEEWLDFEWLFLKHNAQISEITSDKLAYPFYAAKITK